MSISTAVARMAELQTLAQRALAPAAPPQAAAPAVSPTAAGGFQTLLAQAAGAGNASMAYQAAPVTAAPAAGGPGAGLRMLAAAQAEVGQAEQPPGSNDGPRIATYRSAVAGAAAGQPWCAYFVSWAAAQAGAPLGENGSGYGAVAQIAAWGARTGRLLPADAPAQPGDIILFGDRHVGIVESVAADGTITTVEGNSSDAVTRRTRSPGEATGFVRLP